MSHLVLTGATGFLGSHLLEALLSKGYSVTILKRSTSDTWRIDHYLDQINSYDVDQVNVEEAFKREKVDAVIHTACSYGRHGQQAHEVIEANLLFGLRVLDAAISFNCGAFFNTDTLLPKYLNAYSLSKNQFTEWLRKRSDEIKAVNLKLEHMYGPGDDQTKFVPWLVSQLEQGVARVPLTKGTQERDFIYIDDVVSAYIVALENVCQFRRYTEFDVGTGRLTSLRKFVEAIYSTHQDLNRETATQLGFGDIELREGEMMTVNVNNEALRALGWTPKISQAEGLKKLFRVGE